MSPEPQDPKTNELIKLCEEYGLLAAVGMSDEDGCLICKRLGNFECAEQAINWINLHKDDLSP